MRLAHPSLLKCAADYDNQSCRLTSPAHHREVTSSKELCPWLHKGEGCCPVFKCAVVLCRLSVLHAPRSSTLAGPLIRTVSALSLPCHRPAACKLASLDATCAQSQSFSYWPHQSRFILQSILGLVAGA